MDVISWIYFSDNIHHPSRPKNLLGCWWMNIQFLIVSLRMYLFIRCSMHCFERGVLYTIIMRFHVLSADGHLRKVFAFLCKSYFLRSSFSFRLNYLFCYVCSAISYQNNCESVYMYACMYVCLYIILLYIWIKTSRS